MNSSNIEKNVVVVRRIMQVIPALLVILYFFSIYEIKIITTVESMTGINLTFGSEKKDIKANFICIIWLIIPIVIAAMWTFIKDKPTLNSIISILGSVVNILFLFFAKMIISEEVSNGLIEVEGTGVYTLMMILYVVIIIVAFCVKSKKIKLEDDEIIEDGPKNGFY